MVQSIQNLCLIYQNADDQFIDAHYMQILRFFFCSTNHAVITSELFFDDKRYILDEEKTCDRMVPRAPSPSPFLG